MKGLIGVGVVLGATVVAALQLTTSESNIEPRAHVDATETARRSISRQLSVGDESLDLGSLAERTHFAFEQTAQGLIGGDATYGVLVAGDLVNIHPEDLDSAYRAVSVGAPLQLRTVSVNGQQSSAVYELAYDGHLSRIEGPGIRESLRNTRRGLEQSWEVDQAPTTSFGMQIKLAVAGQDYVTSTVSGLHFTDHASSLGVAYGRATWIDARGISTGLDTTYENGVISIDAPQSLVDTSAYPVSIDPSVSAEHTVDSPLSEPAEQIQMNPAIGHSEATNFDFLVVWQDRRRTLSPGLQFDIYGSHVDQRGNVREPVGFLITARADGLNHTQPTATWVPGFTEYVVSDVADNGTASGLEMNFLLGATQTIPAGTPIPVEACHGTCANIAAAENTFPDSTQRVLFAWDDSFGVNLVIENMTGPAAATGNILSTHPGRAPRVSGSNDNFGAVSSSGRWLLVYQDPTFNILGIRVDETGGQLNLGATIFPRGGANQDWDSPDVAYFGSTSSWIVVADYDNFSGGVDFEIKSREISTSGTQGAIIPVATGPGQQFNPHVAGYGGVSANESYVTWAESSVLNGPTDLRGRVERSPLGSFGSSSAPVTITTSQTYSNGGDVHSDEINGYFTVWGDTRNSSFGDIYGGRVDFTNVPLSPQNFPISNAVNQETTPAIAKCGSSYLTAWTDTRNGELNTDIYGSIVNVSGTIIMVQNIPISVAAGNQTSPAIACNGTDFYVVWTDGRNSGSTDVFGTRVAAATGAVLDPTGVAIANSTGWEGHPAIAYGGGNYAVVLDEPGGIVLFARVSGTSGALIAPPVSVAIRGGYAFPDIDFDGSEFWVVYQGNYPSGSNTTIYGNPISTAGVVGLQFPLGASTINKRYPKVKWNSGGNFFVAVYEFDTTGFGVDIGSLKFSSTGVYGGSSIVASATANERAPRIANRDASNQEVVFYIENISPFDYDVYGQTLSLGALSGSSYPISVNTSAREMTPAIDCSTTTSCIAVYRSFLAGVGAPNSYTDVTNTDRIKSRTISYP